ncbi:hypothetical protein HNP02_000884 [Mycobacterium sp. AZCC_0083]|nr:alpha-hydroxy-acid oxidizing protein [Mycobacterium sp. AZCC_0083]MBB5160948.1 hypothetical protein [Mycobacterium sp. AZCC_0083]
MKRRLPRPSELAPLLQFRKPRLNATARRLADALTIEDLRRIAKRRTPKAAFDYTDGAAEVDTGWQVLGDRVEQPFGIAPTGFTRLMNTEGEIAGARCGPRRHPV